MSKHQCERPLSLSDLVAYNYGDLTDSAAERVEETYFSCGACAERLRWVSRLEAAVTSLVRDQLVSATVTESWLEHATRQGIRLRTYVLSPETTVACTAAPDDEFVVVRLRIPAEPGESVRLRTEAWLLESGERAVHQAEDVPVDHQAGEVITAYAADVIRSYPRSRWTVHATITGQEGERTVGPYILDHTPWQQLAGAPIE